MHNRFDYQMNNNNVASNYSEEYMTKENKKLREDIYAKDEKMEILFNFLTNMQHSILNRTSSITVLQNLDILTLRTRINEIQDEASELFYKNQRQKIDSGANLNGTMKTPPSNLQFGMRNFRELSEDNEKIRY